MNIHYLEREQDIVDTILEADGYRFQIKGTVTQSQVKVLAQMVETRLTQEGAISKGPIIKDVYVIATQKREIQRKKAVGDVVSLSDFYRDIDMTIVYILLCSERVVDEFTVNITLPLLMDCESIDDLFDADGYYTGSQRGIEESLIF